MCLFVCTLPVSSWISQSLCLCCSKQVLPTQRCALADEPFHFTRLHCHERWIDKSLFKSIVRLIHPVSTLGWAWRCCFWSKCICLFWPLSPSWYKTGFTVNSDADVAAISNSRQAWAFVVPWFLNIIISSHLRFFFPDLGKVVTPANTCFTVVWTDDIGLCSCLEMALRDLPIVCVRSSLSYLDFPIVLVNPMCAAKQDFFKLAKTNYCMWAVMLTNRKVIGLGIDKIKHNIQHHLLKALHECVHMYLGLYAYFWPCVDQENPKWSQTCAAILVFKEVMNDVLYNHSTFLLANFNISMLTNYRILPNHHLVT